VLFTNKLVQFIPRIKKQLVSCRDVESDKINKSFEIPQDSIHGPLLFNLYNIKLNVCLYILYANLQFYSDLDEILYT
jgi:hypothetical protein